MEKNQNNNQNQIGILIIVIIVATLAIIGSNYYMIKSFSGSSSSGNIVSQVEDKLTELEAERVGGQENYEMLQKMYNSEKFQQQQRQSLQQTLSQYGVSEGQGNTQNQQGQQQGQEDTNQQNQQGQQQGQEDTNQQNQPDQEQNNQQANNQNSDSNKIEGINSQFNQGTLSDDQLQQVKEGSFFKGSENTKITWLEYSDLECPFCKRHHNQGTVGQVMDNYSEQLNFAFKHFPLTRIHPNAEKGARALQCVGELSGKEQYYTYIDEVFNMSDVTEENIKQKAFDMGVNEQEFNSCYNSEETSTKVQNDLNDGQTIFGINGTPGNVLINNETGQYVVIPGAYPASQFNDIVSKLLDQ